MKRISVFAACLVAVMAFAASAFGQAAPASGSGGKVALVNVGAFADEKTGINRFRTALMSVGQEFEPVNKKIRDLQTRYTTLANEIQNQQKLAADPANKVPINTSGLQTKIEEAQNLEIQIKREQEDGKRKYDARYAQVVGPVYNDIIKGLNDFAKQKGYAVILDGAKLEESGILMGFDEKYDVTKEFIAFFNSRPAGTATTTSTPK